MVFGIVGFMVMDMVRRIGGGWCFMVTGFLLTWGGVKYSFPTLRFFPCDLTLGRLLRRQFPLNLLLWQSPLLLLNDDFQDARCWLIWCADCSWLYWLDYVLFWVYEASEHCQFLVFCDGLGYLGWSLLYSMYSEVCLKFQWSVLICDFFLFILCLLYL